MKSLSKNAIRLARILIAIVFVLNAIGIIDQTIPAKEMMERGVPAAIVPWFMFAGRMLEFIAGAALVFGGFPRTAALTLLAFPIPATLVSHSFWLSAGTPSFMGQLINFSKNLAICGGLLFIGASSNPAGWDAISLYGMFGRVHILKTRGKCHEGNADFVCRRVDCGCYLRALARSESGTAFSRARRTAGYGLGRASDRQLSGETKPDNVRPT
jgi:putative oxidoreductase